ncbi:MAG: hypothetical protein JST62_05070 [Bacteroidetes bacterium]|nr:hypothetical protein [Bacteroidota bacterium]
MIYIFGAGLVFLMITIVWSYKKKYFEWTEDYLKFNLFQPRKYYFKDLRNCKFSDDSYVFQFNNETVIIKKKNIKEEELPNFLSKINQLNLEFKNNNQLPISSMDETSYLTSNL